MIDISRVRSSSSPDLPNSTPNNPEKNVNHNSHLEGVSTNVMVLLKLIHDHNEASSKDNDERRALRVAGMMTVLDEVKNRIQKSQSISKRREIEFRRCNTELRPRHAPRDEPIMDEKVKLRKELNASLAARKSLEIICSSLGKEKEIMSTELARKVHELNGMEELINDLKAQNENLLSKIQRERKCNCGKEQVHGNNNSDLQERNKQLSEQLLKSLVRYRSLKRKLKEAKEENAVFGDTFGEMGVQIAERLGRIRSFKQHGMVVGTGQSTETVEEAISAIENIFEGFEIKLLKQGKKKEEGIAKDTPNLQTS